MILMNWFFLSNITHKPRDWQFQFYFDMRVPKDLFDLLFSYDSYSKDYLFEVLPYLNAQEFCTTMSSDTLTKLVSLSRVNKFMHHFISSPDIWHILADKNGRVAQRTVQERFEWKGIATNAYLFTTISL